ncbi:hypothetical protein PV-S19_0412 [Pacmanvirus S19]|nr:hypothetical protein PV-S19_0412 [Pacmanvirus S19]
MKILTIVIFYMLYQTCYATNGCSDNKNNKYITNNITNINVTNINITNNITNINITNINTTNVIGGICPNITEYVITNYTNYTNYTKLISDISSQNDIAIAAIVLSCISIFISFLLLCSAGVTAGYLSYEKIKKCVK